MDERFRFNVGEFQCTAINDGWYAAEASVLFANAPEEELVQVLEKYGERADAISSPLTCLLIKAGSSTLLIDTGMGSGPDSGGGQLLPALQAEGVSPDDVDMVILTHAHGDHILGTVLEDGRLAFPRASYIMGKDEWAFWTSEEELESVSEWAANTARRILPALATKMRPVEGMATVMPGIRVLDAPGHTHGHTVVEIASQGEQFLYFADTALHPIHLEYPGWTALYDQFPEQTVKSRLAVFERACQRNSLVLAFHFSPFPGLGHIVQEGDRWQWKPIEADSGRPTSTRPAG